MAGSKVTVEPLLVATGGDYLWGYHYTDEKGAPLDYPEGAELYYLLGEKGKSVKYPYTIEGDYASIKVESEVCDLWEHGTPYRLLFQEQTIPNSTEQVVLMGQVSREEPRDFDN